MASLFRGLTLPILLAHRGASRHAPENTFPAFELAAAMGADVLEMDVHLSKDAEVVVIHDETLERTTDGSGLVREHTLVELGRLNAGYRFEMRPGDFRFRGAELRIPLLEDVLRAFPEMSFNIELKEREPSMVRSVLRVLEQAPPRGTVLLAAYDDAVMRELEQAYAAGPLGLSSSQAQEVIRSAYRGGSIEKYRGRALQIPLYHRSFLFGHWPLPTGRVLRHAHQAGIEVHIWTINDSKSARRWLGRGVDGIFSDDPVGMSNLFGEARTR